MEPEFHPVLVQFFHPSPMGTFWNACDTVKVTYSDGHSATVPGSRSYATTLAARYGLPAHGHDKWGMGVTCG